MSEQHGSDSKMAWLWPVIGWLAGVAVGIALVALLGGDAWVAGPGAIQGIVPGLVLVTGQRLRGDGEPVILRPRDVVVIVGAYVIFLGIAFSLDQRAGEPPVGRWLSSFIGFTVASIGGYVSALRFAQRTT